MKTQFVIFDEETDRYVVTGRFYVIRNRDNHTYDVLDNLGIIEPVRCNTPIMADCACDLANAVYESFAS